MRKHRTLLRRLWRNTPPERVPIRVTWIDGETTYINGDNADWEKAAAHAEPPPAPKDKPSSYNGDR